MKEASDLFYSKTEGVNYLSDAEFNGYTKPGPAHYGQEGRIDHIYDKETRCSTAVMRGSF